MNKLALLVMILASVSAIIIACGESAAPTSAPATAAPTSAPAAAAAVTAPEATLGLVDAAKEAAVPKPTEAFVGVAGGVSPGAVEAVAPVVGKLLSYGTFTGEITLVDKPAKYTESPWSAELVAAGDIPPLEERISNPLVLQVDEIGEYGGVMRRMQTDPGSINSLAGRISHRGLLRSSGDGNSFLPSYAGSYSPNEDGSVWTVKTRAGGKWSDGSLNTSEDYRYQWEVYNDDTIVGNSVDWIRESGDPRLQVVVIDENTVEYRYSAPNWLFEIQVAEGQLSVAIPLYPSEYMKQYNANYNPGAQKLAEDAGHETWELYYTLDRIQWRQNPKIPSMSPYLFETNSAQEIVHLSRNHYYNMVDQEGNQLPYIDGARIGPAKSGPDAIALSVVQGEVDWQARPLDISQFPLLRDGEEKGNYKVRLVPDTGGTYVDLRFNLTYHGPERELLGNKDFRIALSQAIDRDVINEAVFLGQGTPRNGLPSPEHPFYPGPEYERMYWTDIPASNAALDSLMGPRDGEGFRTMPNGDRFHLELLSQNTGPRPEAAELMCLDIQEVGVRCTIFLVGGGIRTQRTRASDWMASPTGNCCAEALYMFGGASLPTSRGSWAPEYGGWYRVGEGEEPPDWLKEIYTHYEAAKLAPENAVKGAQEIFKSLIEQAVQPGIMGGLGSRAVVVVHNDLAGVPDTWANRAGLQPHQNAFTERFYFSNPERRTERPKQFAHCPGC